MGRRVVTFGLGAERYGVAALAVVQVLRHEGLRSLPRPAAFVSGAVTVRGDVVPVVDLRARLGIAARAAEPQDLRRPSRSGDRKRILVVRHAGRTCGLAVEEVGELLDLPDDAVAPAPEMDAGAPIVEIARLPDGELRLLDLGQLLSPPAGIAP